MDKIKDVSAESDFLSILRSYKTLIGAQAWRLSSSDMELRNDLIAAGNGALWEAYCKYTKDHKKRAAFNTFAYFYVKNRMIDELRHICNYGGHGRGRVQGRRQDREEHIDTNGEGRQPANFDTEDEIIDEMESKRRLTAVAQAAQNLSPMQSTVVLMTLTGLKQQEIARRLNRNAGAVSVHMASAIKHLKRRLIDHTKNAEGERCQTRY